mmetsp:Transcript_38165/g.85817  ORF Transcript_38165/g.85817 Transcript_38165/m.85817 type:complete len:169 (+) Transcript_38165:137-643(+)
MLTSVRLAVLILIISAAAAMPRKQLRLARHLQAGDEPALVAATDDEVTPDDAIKDEDEDSEYSEADAAEEGEEEDEDGDEDSEYAEVDAAEGGEEEDEDLDEIGVIDDGPIDGSDDALVFEIEQSGQSGSFAGWMYWGLGGFLAVTLGVVLCCRRGATRGLGYEPVPE